MRLDDKESYVFEVGNKNGLVSNLSKTLLTKDSTILVKFTPDFKEMESRFDENNRYSGCVVGKNGHHMGIMVECHTSADGYEFKSVGFEFWVNDGEGIDIRQIQYNISERDPELPIEFILKRRGNKFITEFDGEIKEADCTDLADYSFSMLWIGAANRIIDTHNNIFFGDIDRLHIQESYLDDAYCKLFFSDFDKFLPKGTNPDNNPIFTGNFKDITPYKIKDLSGNGYHPIIFRKEWMM